MGVGWRRPQLARRSPADGPRPIGARLLRMSIIDFATVSSRLVCVDSNRGRVEVKRTTQTEKLGATTRPVGKGSENRIVRRAKSLP